MRFIEKRLAPLAGKIGFHADFPLDGFLDASRLQDAARVYGEALLYIGDDDGIYAS